MPWLPRAAALAATPEQPSVIATTLLQLLRGPTQPTTFPESIVSGLSSTDASVQLAAIAELRAYIRRLFFLDVDNYFEISSLVTAGIIAVLILIGIPVVLHRLYYGRLHIWRLERRAQGSYLIPNAINCFLLLEGLYGILTVAFNAVVWELFHKNNEVYVRLFQAFRSLVWIPLFCGAFLTGWGSLYTAPDTLDKPTASHRKTSARGRLPWPLIVNLTCWGLPLVLIVSLLPPVCLSSVKMTNAFNAYKDWDSRFQSLIEATVANTVVNQMAVNDMRAQAYAIFTDWSRSYYYIDVGYVLWGFWAILFLVFYVPAGGVLVFLLYRQVNRQRAILESHQRKLELQLAQEERQAEEDEKSAMHARNLVVPNTTKVSSSGGFSGANPVSRAGATLENIYEDRGVSNDSRATGHSNKSGHDVMGLETALGQEPSESFGVHGALSPGLGSALGHVASLAKESGEDVRASTSQPNTPVTPGATSAFRRLIRIETSASSNKAGQTSSKSAKRKRVSLSSGPMSRYKYLRRCLVNLLILYFGIISAAACFGAVTIYLAAVEYEHALQGPDSVAHSISVAGAVAAWASAVFGALTIGSIVFRNFDNPNPEASQGSDGPPKRRFARASKNTDSAGAERGGPAVVEKTRTLPAVPESVDLEASGVQSRPQMAMGTSMKFALGEQGFVFRDDQLASMMSAGEMEEMRQPVRPAPVVRAWGREREATMSIPQDVTESFGLMSAPMIGGRAEEGYGTNDTTLAEYPAFDPRLVETAQFKQASSDARIAVHAFNPTGSPITASVDSRIKRVPAPITASVDTLARPASSTTPASSPPMPTSPVMRRQSRMADVLESPASKLAREWAEGQYATRRMPDTPTAMKASTWGEAKPERPARDARRL
ncbi:hypothetical protein PSEUBRA_002285 [Kalmanozyma brasiliensis GHG001]|uniref:Uncharacterized protein n=1 Tax=Kalmanozyma brasiliensis (strain GHG001) TaxID=1365824 RepID=V5GQI5_KALBG|nr:uncharacterized protein PSEUBRA_002285 [Kalmanozyma brasiliensis GHG001]EST08197.1 hypothetical protein PSEUBRA_002285 [Kalmanozyma brasiliensis GHG001]